MIPRRLLALALAPAALALVPAAAEAAPPSCAGPSVGVPHNATLPIFLCSDPDGAVTVSITDAPDHGTVSSATPGWRNYTPAVGYAGADSFSYSAEQGGETATGTATL